MRAALLPLWLGLLAAALVVASGYGARFGLWDWRAGLQIVRWSPYAGIAIATLALAFMLVPGFRRGRIVALAAALALGAAVAWFPWQWLQAARAAAAINDITTDLADPPAFVAILPLRAGASVSPTHPGAATADVQRRAYPDIVPLELAVPPAAAHARALAAAKAMGWEIVAVDAAAGRIEATANTPWFGFRDDVVVRVAPTAHGSRIDVRSVSRVGRGDFGTNARRIRDYIARVNQ